MELLGAATCLLPVNPTALPVLLAGGVGPAAGVAEVVATVLRSEKGDVKTFC
jgi:hypothetical protein